MDDVPSRIDHTVLGPTTTPADVDAIVETAAELGTNACVPPCYVERARERLSERDAARSPQLVTVLGFPHGQHATDAKSSEAEIAAAAGADELDLVANVGLLRAGEDERVRDDLAAVTDAVDVPVKAIVKAPLLEGDELERACELAADAGCSHVKTATGFEDGGATVEDVATMAEYLPVKASGGIGSWERAIAMFDAGADRIGASSGDAIVREWRAATERE